MKVADFNYAKEKGYTIKLIAKSQVDSVSGEITSTVLPTFVDLKKTIALVNNEYNGVLIGSSLADEQFLYGKGAGRFPTSSAVLSDISALKYDYKYSIRKFDQTENAQFNQTGNVKIFIGYEKEELDLNSFFNEIEERFQGKEYSYVVGEISLEKLKEIIHHPAYSVVAFE